MNKSSENECSVVFIKVLKKGVIIRLIEYTEWVVLLILARARTSRRQMPNRVGRT